MRHIHAWIAGTSILVIALCAPAHAGVPGDWATPIQLTSPYGGISSHDGRSIALDEFGNLHVLYLRIPTSNEFPIPDQPWHVYYIRYDAQDELWGLHEKVSVFDVLNRTPAMHVTNEGVVHVVWGAEVGDSIFMTHRFRNPANGAWSDPHFFFVYPMPSTNVGPYPVLADADNRLHVVLAQRHDPGPNSTIWHTSYDGSWWGPVSSVETPAEKSPFPTLASNTGGQLVLVWTSGEDGEEGVHLRWFSHGTGQWGPTEDATTTESRWVRPLLADSGVLHLSVVTDYVLSDLYYIQRNTSGTWSAPTILSTGDVALYGSITADNADNIYVVWSEFERGVIRSHKLYMSVGGPTGAWSPAEWLFPNTPMPQYRGELAFDPAGRAHLVFTHRPPGQEGNVFYSYADPDPTGIPSSSPPLSLSQNAPNPFRPTTRLSFVAPDRGYARVEVFGVNGRRITTLLDKVVDRGEHTLQWDGKNDVGLDMPAGVYFYRIEGFGRQMSRKMVLLR
jgi:hypothetical protein